VTSSEGKDNDASGSVKDAHEENKVSAPELLDELIMHMNSMRNVFKVMILSAFILAPISLMLAGVLVIHPFFLHRIFFRFPEVGVFLLVFIGVSMMLASMWLYIGLSEQRFFSNWDKKFARFTSLRDKLDRELGG
jgi:MFS superfamily sulfate permease-like transporter